MEALGGSRQALGPSWRLLETLWGSSGESLGTSLAPLGATWEGPGASFLSFGELLFEFFVVSVVDAFAGRLFGWFW